MSIPATSDLLHLKQDIATKMLHVACLSDSFGTLTTVTEGDGSSKSIPWGLFLAGVFSNTNGIAAYDVTAIMPQVHSQGQASNNPFANIGGPRVSIDRLDEGEGYIVEGTTRYGLPVTPFQVEADGSAGNIGTLATDEDATDIGAQGRFFTDSGTNCLGLRILHWGHTSGEAYDADIRVYDDSTTPASKLRYTFTVTDNADNVGGYAEERLNRLIVDISLYATAGNNKKAFFYDNGGTSGRKFTPVPVWFNASDRGVGDELNPTWTPGNQLSILGHGSWTSFGYGNGASSSTAIKQCSEQDLSDFFDHASMSKDALPLVVVCVDQSQEYNYSDGGNNDPTAPHGDMTSKAAFDLIYENLQTRMNSVFDAAGFSETPRILVLFAPQQGTDATTPNVNPWSNVTDSMVAAAHARSLTNQRFHYIDIAALMEFNNFYNGTIPGVSQTWLVSNGYSPSWTPTPNYGSALDMAVAGYPIMGNGSGDFQHPKKTSSTILIGDVVRTAIADARAGGYYYYV